MLTRVEAAALYNETIKRLKIPLSKCDTIRSNSILSETVAHLRAIGVITPGPKLTIDYAQCANLWSYLTKQGMTYHDWSTWPAEIERPELPAH